MEKIVFMKKKIMESAENYRSLRKMVVNSALSTSQTNNYIIYL